MGPEAILAVLTELGGEFAVRDGADGKSPRLWARPVRGRLLGNMARCRSAVKRPIQQNRNLWPWIDES